MKPWKAITAVLALLTIAAVAHAIQRTSVPLYTGAAGDTTSVGMADSTSIIGTQNYERLYLHLKPNKPCKVAIQIRQHGITDTARASLPDTTNTAVWPWIAYTSATDTLSLLQTTLPSAVQAGANELTVYFPQTGVEKWGGVRGLYIPLQSKDGAWYWGRQTSIRLRVLTAYGAADPVVTWTANLEGVGW